MKNTKHRIIFVLSILVLLIGFYYYIYHGDSYLRDNSKDLSISTICHDNFSCSEGYRLISYPTHSKIFYEYYSFCQFWCSYRNSVVFLDGVDIESFRVLGRNYAVDKNNLYYRYEVVDATGLDLNSLSVVEGSDMFAKDNKYVLYAGKKIPDAKSDDFRFLNEEALKTTDGNGPVFSKSGDNLFVRGTQANKAVRNGRFHVILDSIPNLSVPCINKTSLGNSYYSCDITNTGKDVLIKVDVETFEVIKHPKYDSVNFADYITYAKDKNYVYYLDKNNSLYVVEGADLKTFRIEKSDSFIRIMDDSDEYIDGCSSNNAPYPYRSAPSYDEPSLATICTY